MIVSLIFRINKKWNGEMCFVGNLVVGEVISIDIISVLGKKLV